MDIGAEAAEELLETLVDAHLLETAPTRGGTGSTTCSASMRESGSRGRQPTLPLAFKAPTLPRFRRMGATLSVVFNPGEAPHTPRRAVPGLIASQSVSKR